MKRLYFYISMLFVMSIFTSCDLFNQDDTKTIVPTSDEIVQGLKKALELGTDSSSTKLSALNGYFTDQAVKILLPPEASSLIDKVKGNEVFTALGLDKKVDNVVLSINRAAEFAATKAKPIFSDAITNLSITDGLSILNGQVPSSTKSSSETSSFDSLAATHYLKQQTFTQLTTAFSDPINAALDQNISELGFSANQAWNTLTGAYNGGVEKYNLVASLAGNSQLTKIDVNLATYCTQKALDGLFLKVGDQEKQIRKNPYEWAVDIITKVFGYVFK